MKGSYSSHGFDHGFTPDLPVSVLLSVVLHVGLLLLLSYSPFMMIQNAGQPTLINVDLVSAPEVTPAPAPAPVEKAETPPAKPTPPPVVKKAEPKAKPTPAKDDVVIKKVKPKKPEPVPQQKAPVEEAKPLPPKKATPAPPKVASVPREPKKVRPATPAPAVPEETNPISSLEGAREGVDVSTNYYIQNMVAQIARRWRPPGSIRYDRNVQPVIVYFKIQKDGRLTSISVETSSGRKDLDLSAERAVMETKSIPPLPPNLMQEDTLGVHFKFIPKLAGG